MSSSIQIMAIDAVHLITDTKQVQITNSY